jgi:hypothetical protein
MSGLIDLCISVRAVNIVILRPSLCNPSPQSWSFATEMDQGVPEVQLPLKELSPSGRVWVHIHLIHRSPP